MGFQAQVICLGRLGIASVGASPAVFVPLSGTIS
jgi:hypothetical protein